MFSTLIILVLIFMASCITVGWVDQELVADIKSLKAQGMGAKEAEEEARKKPGKIFGMTRGQQHDWAIGICLIVWVVVLLKAIQIVFKGITGT
jgi:hypothetical protein